MKLTDKQKAELEALDNMPDEEIHFSDIPEVTDLSDAIRNAYYLLQAGESPSRLSRPRSDDQAE